MQHIVELIISWFDNESRFAVEGIDWKEVEKELERIIKAILDSDGNVVIQIYTGCEHCQKPVLHYIHGVSLKAYTRQKRELEEFLARDNDNSYKMSMETFIHANVGYLLSQLMSVVEKGSSYGPNAMTRLLMWAHAASFTPPTKALQDHVTENLN